MDFGVRPVIRCPFLAHVPEHEDGAIPQIEGQCVKSVLLFDILRPFNYDVMPDAAPSSSGSIEFDISRFGGNGSDKD
ncbi:hypothetical protein DOTSEDRAFT_72796 [Dothistroma septosporum NZE10]|uniref:Uncharacterized protein n=1 Tax=Dothistroma septosporum (strain NZE10 / CBS 128990) TaxID=675120 RepID=M2XM60_DOTSN|nr:hypothetical protein DOTSEDRAFT_72796 [Dothistroma septosporum NZE10]